MSDSKYQVVLADTPEARQLHFRLRYQVFCCDTGFEPAERFPDGLERDIHDPQAVHFLVRNTSSGDDGSGKWVGAMRLILPGPEPFPISTHCNLLHGGAAHTRGSMAEVSRMIVRDDNPLPEPLILFLLCSAGHGFSQRHGLKYLYFLIRPALIRLLRSQGLEVDLCGDPCEHRGVRFPCRLTAANLATGLGRWQERLQSLGSVGILPYVRYTGLFEKQTGRSGLEEGFITSPAMA